jgi:hypothetical protein
MRGWNFLVLCFGSRCGSSGMGRIVAGPMGGIEYVYELRRGEEVVATGRLVLERPSEVGERVAIGGLEGIVRAVEALLGERALKLVIQLVRPSDP